MKLKEIADLLDAKVICGASGLDSEIESACGSDMMSEVLAFTKHNSVLLTGLINNQVLRTADMLDITSIVFIRGKQPDSSVVEMAEDMGITLLTTEMPMFSACGVLYVAGLKPGMRKE